MTTRLLQSIKNVSVMTVRTLAAQKGGNLSGAKLGGSFGTPTVNKDVDFSALDVRVGKVLGCRNHPDANNLYVEQIDVGEMKCRTVCSGLTAYMTADEVKLKDQLVIVLCNLKPSKLRGILSEAMILCATENNATELLLPPTGACTGDRITVDGCCVDGEPAVEINKKNKIFEKVMLDLRTNENAVATYKQKPLTILGKGFVYCKGLKNASIK